MMVGDTVVKSRLLEVLLRGKISQFGQRTAANPLKSLLPRATLNVLNEEIEPNIASKK